jgi:drug/metabolite transporter (DMT)-like permease
VFAAALFGASTPAAKLLVRDVDPLRLAGLLYLGAAIAVAPFALRGGRAENRWQKKNVLRVSGVVVFGGIAAPVLLLLGLERAHASSVALWLNLEPAATAVLAAALFREHIGRRGWIAVIVVSAASTLLASPRGFETGSAALLVAGACVCWSLDNNLSALIDGFTPAQSTFVKGAVAGVTNLALGTIVSRTSLPPIDIAGALALGAISYGGSLVLYVAGAQQLGATRSQMLFATGPLFGAAIAWLVLAEPVTPLALGAALVMTGALVWLQLERHEHTHHHEAQVHTHWHRHDDGHHDHEHEGIAPGTWHVHEHRHDEATHSHAHRPDLHHRHEH